MIWRHANQKAYVSLGSNMGDRAANLLLGVRGMLHAGLSVCRLSSIYETEPVDMFEQPMFLNMVAELRITQFSAEQVMARLLRVEYAMGRRREIKSGPRNIDLDLLLFGSEQRNTEFLTLPHPRMHERRFVLEPLAELVPAFVHSASGKSVKQLLAEVDDDSEVTRWSLQSFDSSYVVDF